MYKSQYNYLD